MINHHPYRTGAQFTGLTGVSLHLFGYCGYSGNPVLYTFTNRRFGEYVGNNVVLFCRGRITGRRSACHFAEYLFAVFNFMNTIAWGPQVKEEKRATR